ncbi:MAG TPA: hypothetical protein VL242_32775, partial [Sorangium sp.]|nr:hypothetical protein [Sorangium sp.]
MRTLLKTCTLVSLLALGIGFAACSSEPGAPAQTGLAQSALTPAASCDEVESLLRERLKQNMIESVEASRTSALEQLDSGCYWWGDDGGAGNVASAGAGGPLPGAPSAGATSAAS